MENKKKREWVKNALIIFLVVLLVLTFCSNTIMNIYLPEVSCEAVVSGKLQESIRGTGSAETGQAYEVKTAQTRKVRSVNVKPGSEVKSGDILFVLEEGGSEELETAKSTYIDLKTDYEKKLLGTSFNYKKDKLAIDAAKLEYEKAVTALKNVGKNQKEITDTEKALKNINNKIDKTQKKITQYESDIAELTVLADETAKKEDLTAKKRTLTVLTNELNDLDADLLAMKNGGTSTSEEITQKERERRNKAVEVDNAKADVSAAEKALKDASDSKVKLDETKNKKEASEAKLASYTARQTGLNTQLETLRANTLTKEEAQAAVKEKENAWNSLIVDLEIKREEDNKTSESEKIELEAAKNRMETQKKLVEEMEKLVTEPEIKAEMDGIVTAVNVAPGDATVPEEAMATIASQEGGFVVKISVSKEQAAKVKRGQSAEVVNYWGDEVKAVLRNIETDTENQANMLLTFAVSGSYIVAGDSMTISIGGGSKDYELIAPKSAIHEDNTGKFVLVVETKNTPLGTRYIAARHNVEVLAEDDTRAAISTDLYGHEYLITTATLVVNSGDFVKMKE